MTRVSEGGSNRGAVILGGGAPIRPKRKKKERRQEPGRRGAVAVGGSIVRPRRTTIEERRRRESLPPRPRVDPGVIKRQQVLRRLGYGVTVDGVNGARTQTAWAQFVRDLRRQHSPGTAGRPKPTPVKGGVLRQLPPRTTRQLQIALQQRDYDVRMRGFRDRSRPGARGAVFETNGVVRPGPAEAARLAELEADRRRQKDIIEIARRNPTLERALLPGRHRGPLGLRSVPWARRDIVRALTAKDVLRFIEDDAKSGDGIFLRRDRNGLRVTRTAVEMLRAWGRERGVELPANPRGDQISGFLGKLARRAQHAEIVRHNTAVKRSYFDTGIAQHALADLGIGRNSGGYDLWTPAGFAAAVRRGKDPRIAAVLREMGANQTKELVDDQWEQWRQTVVAGAGVLNAVFSGDNPLRMGAPVSSNGLWVPRSLTDARDERTYQLRALVERAYYVLAQAKRVYAAKLSAETGHNYWFDEEKFLRNPTLYGADVGIETDAPSEKDDGNSGIAGRYFGAIGEAILGGAEEGTNKGVELTAEAMAAAGAPATWVVDRVLGASSYAASGALVTSAGLDDLVRNGDLYVNVHDFHPALRGVGGYAIAVTAMGLEESIAKGHAVREHIPDWAEFLLETVFDPLNFVGASWITKPIAAVRRFRGGSLVEKTVASHADRTEDVIDAALPAADAEPQRNRLARFFQSKAKVQNEIADELERRIRTDDWDDIEPPRLGVAAEAERVRRGLEVEAMGAPALAGIIRHIESHRGSLYQTADRKHLTRTGVHVMGRLKQWYRGTIHRQLLREYPDVDGLGSLSVAPYAHGASHPKIQARERELTQKWDEMVEDRVLPLIQEILEKRWNDQGRGLIFDDKGHWVADDAQMEFEQMLADFGRQQRDLVEEGINPVYGMVLDRSEFEDTVAFEVEQIVGRDITHDRMVNWEAWAYDEDGQYAQAFVHQATLRAERAVKEAFINPGEEGAADVLDEVNRRTAEAHQHVDDLDTAIQANEQRLDTVLDVAGEFFYLARELGEHVHWKLPGHDRGGLITRWLDNAQGRLPIEEPKRRFKQLADAFARAEAGLAEVDWDELAVWGKVQTERAERVVADFAEAVEVSNGSVLTRKRVRATIELALEHFLEGDLITTGLHRGSDARKRLAIRLDAGHQRVLDGGITRQALVDAISRVVAETDEVVGLRHTLEEAQEALLAQAAEIERLMGQGAAIPFEQIRRAETIRRDLEARVYKASGAYFTALWSTGDPARLGDVLKAIEAERGELAMLRAEENGLSNELELLDRVLARRQTRIEYLARGAKKRRPRADDGVIENARIGLRSAIIEAEKELRGLRRSRDAAADVARHYDALDVGRIVANAVERGGLGWVDTRPTIKAPKMYWTHQRTRRQNLSDVADEADSFAWLAQDDEFQLWPEDFNPAGFDTNTTAGAARAVIAAGDRTPRAEVQMIQPQSTPDRAPTPGPNPVGESAWALGEARAADRGARPNLALETVSSDAYRRVTTDEVQRLSRQRLARLMRDRVAYQKHYADVLRAKRFKQAHAYVVAMKYSASQPIRAAYWLMRAGLQVWKTAVLPLTAGWMVINYIDGTAKALVKGIIDPRRWVNPSGKSFPEWAPISLISWTIKQLDARYATNVGEHFDRLVRAFYSQHPVVLDHIFGAHGIPFPKELMSGFVAQSIRVAGDDTSPVPRGSVRQAVQTHKRLDREARAWENRAMALREHDPIGAMEFAKRASKARRRQRLLAAQAFHDAVWQLAVGASEAPFRKMAYYEFYEKALVDLRDEFPILPQVELEQRAVMRAMEQVGDVFFDPSRISALEDTLSVIWPFVNFVRQNTRFWVGALADEPWILSGLDRLDDYQEENGDIGAPSWLERYAPVAFLGELPLLSHLNDTLFKDGHVDPRNLTSLGLLWRTFKDRNELLGDEQGGIAFLNQFVNATSDIGLGLSPFVRKAGELTGLIAPEFWRDVFPQTTLVQALSADYLNRRFPDGFNLEEALLDPIWKEIEGKSLSEAREADFNQLVQREMAAQKLHGQPVDRAAAEKKISDYLYVNTLWAWGTHIYLRRVTAADAWFYKQSEEMRNHPDGDTYLRMDAQQQQAYSIFSRRGTPAKLLDAWIEDQGKVALYWQLDASEKDEFWALHPEITPYVLPSNRAISVNGRKTTSAEIAAQRASRRRRNQILAARTEVVMGLYDALPTQANEKAYRTFYDQAYDHLVTPELEAFWRSNDTPYKLRATQMRLEFERVIDQLHEDFYAIPNADWRARQAFLAANPVLVEHWRRSGVKLAASGLPVPGAQAEALLDLVQLFRKHARDYYFALVDNGGWDVAAAWLRRHSDIFVGTKKERFVSEIGPDAFWVPGGLDSERGQMYVRIKPWLDEYFSHPAKSEARRQVGREHPEVYEYFDRFTRDDDGTKGQRRYSNGDRRLTQHAQDYLAVKEQLDAYFALPKGAQRSAYLDDHPDVVAYFKKYSKRDGGRGGRGRARRWVDARQPLDEYFALPVADRPAYLRRHPEIVDLVDEDDARRKLGGNKLHIARRFEFWMRFFALEPDQRPDFVRREAANHGVFIYGILGAHELWANEQSGFAWQFAHGELSRQQAYTAIKPLMDLYFTLPEHERELFRETNPEIDIYLRVYSKQRSLTGSAKLDELVKGFFDLPDYDVERRQAYLEEHPEVQTWFDSRGTPEEKALGRLVKAYFQVPFDARQQWLAQHPELLAYFELRETQRDQEDAVREALDAADPRVAELNRLNFADEFYAQTVGTKLALTKQKPTPISVRVDRRDERETREDRSTL